MTAPDPSIELMRLINGYQVSQALHIVRLSAIRILETTDKSAPREEGSRECGISAAGPSSCPAGSCVRLARTAASRHSCPP